MPESYDLQALADILGAEVYGDAGCVIYRLNTLQEAGEGELAFLANSAYRRYLATTEASAVLLAANDAESFSGNALIVANPYLAYARLSKLFDPHGGFQSGRHPSAVIAASAQVDDSASIGAHVVVGEGAVIGKNVFLGPGAVVGSDSVLGEGCYLHANVTIYHGVAVGKNCIFHSGAVIGADGFGFAPDNGQWVKIHQLGGVEIGDDVEIGANSTVDRGALGNTVIGRGVIIDNLVQVAHNVEIGDYSALAGCSAVSGSTKIGKHCVLAGGVGLVGHIELCDGVTVTGMTMVTKSIDKPGVYSSGTPLQPSGQWKKNAIRFAQLDKIARRLSLIEKMDKDGH